MNDDVTTSILFYFYALVVGSIFILLYKATGEKIVIFEITIIKINSFKIRYIIELILNFNTILYNLIGLKRKSTWKDRDQSLSISLIEK